jgi:type VI secretion system secreted protein VgrG
VRFLFDLDRWSPGGDSRPVRLAKPFAGGGFGFHLPLHAGTRVNLGFDDGDPDHPYIASVLHDSSKPDHIDSGWHTRNVILTRSTTSCAWRICRARSTSSWPPNTARPS